MVASKREEQVLKLVHPGRHVELHMEPISAAEVLRKNPRHSIARPDVFKFPYIVVRPESTLYPGNVFYIVPNTTIYRLLKAQDQENQPSSEPNKSTKNHGHRLGNNPKRVSPVKSYAGTTLGYLDDRDQRVLKHFQDKNLYMASPREDPDESLTRQSHVKSGPERTMKSLSSICPRYPKENLTRQSHVKSGPERTMKSLSRVCSQDLKENLTKQSHVKSESGRTKKSLSNVCPRDPEESLTKQSHVKSGSGRTKKSLSNVCPRDPEESLTRQSHVKSGSERIKGSLSSVCPREEDFEKNFTRQCHVKSLPPRTRSALSSVCPEETTKNNGTFQADSSIDIGSSHCDRSTSTVQALHRNENGDLHINNREQASTLKSCLRKQDSVRKMQNFKVTFESSKRMSSL